MAEWYPLESCPRDRVVNMKCPGACTASKDILQGVWNERLKGWTLNPYGTTQFVMLYPSLWSEIETPPG